MPGASPTNEKADQKGSQNPEKSDDSSPVDTQTASEQTRTSHESMAPTSADEGGFHFQRPDDNGLSGVQGVSSKHDSSGSPAGSPFGQRHLESTQEWLSAVCGLFSPDNPVSAAIPSATTPSTEDATHEATTQDDFLEWVKTTLELDKKETPFVAIYVCLRRMHDSIALLVSEGQRAGEAIAEVKTAIESISQQIAKLQQAQLDDEDHERTSQPDLTELSIQLHDEEAALWTQEREAERLRHEVMKTVYAPLQTLIAQLKEQFDLKVARLSDLKDKEISDLRVDKLFTHEHLSIAKSSLDTARYEAKTLNHRLITALKQVLDPTARIQELEQQIARLKKENTDLKTSKETTERPAKT